MNNSSMGTNWQDLRKEIFSPEEIAKSDSRVQKMRFSKDLIDAPHYVDSACEETTAPETKIVLPQPIFLIIINKQIRNSVSLSHIDFSTKPI